MNSPLQRAGSLPCARLEARLDDLMPLILPALDAGKSVRFQPQGCSMLPMLRQGRDSVLLTAVPEKLKKYDIALYQRKDGQYVLHRIVKAGSTYTAAGDNQYQYEANLARAQMIAVVSAFTRDERQISVRSPLYRLYCRLWHHSRGIRRFINRAAARIKRCIRRK